MNITGLWLWIQCQFYLLDHFWHSHSPVSTSICMWYTTVLVLYNYMHWSIHGCNILSNYFLTQEDDQYIILLVKTKQVSKTFPSCMKKQYQKMTKINTKTKLSQTHADTVDVIYCAIIIWLCYVSHAHPASKAVNPNKAVKAVSSPCLPSLRASGLCSSTTV